MTFTRQSGLHHFASFSFGIFPVCIAVGTKEDRNSTGITVCHLSPSLKVCVGNKIMKNCMQLIPQISPERDQKYCEL